MSELAKLLTCSTTHTFIADYPRIASVVKANESVSEETESATHAIRYCISARIATYVVARTPDELNSIVSATKRRIVEHVFGEFRLPLLDLRQCLYERDYDAAEKVLNVIFNQMFEDGL